MNKKISAIIILVAVILLGAFYFASNKKNQNSDAAKDQVMVQDKNEKRNYIDIESREAYELVMNNPAVIIVDVSPRFDKGHLPGAINYYVGDGSLDKAIPNFDKNATYLVYCHVDSASIPGAKKLAEAGFPNVYRLKENYPAWIEGGYPIEVEIKAVGKYAGNALASRSFLDGKFTHKVVAKIADPAPSKFYEGWLVKGTSFFSTGKMMKEGDTYILNFNEAKDSRDYKKIVITEETEAQGLDGKPEAHVLEGEFE
ncbi:MAG: rhodanese-like protein [uncultured bacterium]|nr:MAG: rhodanese-like protein [uncultured bacterium]